MPHSAHLAAIDLAIKLGEPLPAAEACRLLCAPPGWLAAPVAADELPRLMCLCPSPLCAAYRRELAIGSPPVYSPEAVAFVHGLPAAPVRAAFEALGLALCPAAALPDVLAMAWR